MASHGSSAPAATPHGPVDWTEQERADIEAIAARFPTRRSAILHVLWMAQAKWGWLSTDVLRRVGDTVGLPPSEVLAVASFYTMFKKQPTGTYLIQVCHTLSCALRGADQMVAHLEKILGVKCGETSADGKFTLMRVECLASCGSAPMMQVNEDFYEFLTEAKLDEIITAFKTGKPLPTPRPEVDQWHWTAPS